MRPKFHRLSFSTAFTLAFSLCLVANCVLAQTMPTQRVNVQIATDEADAILAILDKNEAGKEITDADWQKVFSSEGYVRLKKRESAMKRSFEDKDFKEFVLSDDLRNRRKALAETLASWRQINVDHPAEMALAYLPKNAYIRAKIYPVIKPKDNSFVFEVRENPAIFLYLDPKVDKDEFENTVAHELHHIGYGTSCPSPEADAEIKKLSPEMQEVVRWVGAFGEGFAMLAAAGGPDINPHTTGPAEDKIRWDKDVANFNEDLRKVDKFFLDLGNGKLTEDQEMETAGSFFGTQGPWYTVGWQMSVVIEKTYGRQKLIDCMLDVRKLLPTYNEAVQVYNRKNKTQLTTWSKDLIGKLRSKP